MRVDQLVSSLLRRPLALLLVGVVAVLGAAYGYTHATTTYESRATVVIVPAGTAAEAGAGDNPFTRLDYSIAQLALVVAKQLSSDAVHDQVVAVGGDGNYSADTMSSQNAAVAQLTPMISLSATAPDEQGAVKAVGVLVSQAEAQLASVQSASGVPVADQAQVVTSAPASDPTPVGSPQIRAAGVLGLLGGFTTLLALIVLLPFLEARRARRDGPQVATMPTRSQEAVTPSRSTHEQDERREILDLGPAQAEVEQDGSTQVDPEPDVEPEPERERQVESEAVTYRPAPPVVRSRASSDDRKRRDEAIRGLVRDEWARSGRNVAWTKSERKAAFERAERRLAEIELAGADDEPDNVWSFTDFADRRHG